MNNADNRIKLAIGELFVGFQISLGQIEELQAKIKELEEQLSAFRPQSNIDLIHPNGSKGSANETDRRRDSTATRS
jgi:hypothetical protein